MADNSVTLVGNITDDPELRFTPSGRPVANFTVAVNRRWKDPQGEWQDKLDGFFRCNCWADMAENVAESLKKGTRVVLTGRLQQRTWETPEGDKRSAMEVQVEEIGPSLKWSVASVQKSQRSGGGFQQQGPATGGGPDASSWGAPAPVGGAADPEGGF